MAWAEVYFHTKRRLHPYSYLATIDMGQKLGEVAPHVYCGQTAGWIKMPLGTEVDLGQGDIVLDGDPAPP